METVDLGTLHLDSIFICPWKPDGKNVGRVRRVGLGSMGVHVPNQDADGWETTEWSPATQVIPTDDLTSYHKQSFGDGISTIDPERKSKVESPVETVHSICSELDGDRKAILAECEKRGINPNTAKTQFYAWRKQN